MDSKSVSVTETVESYNGLRDRMGANSHQGKRKLKVTFPCLIKQVDRNQVEIEMEAGPDPFSESFTKVIVEQMGEIGGEAFLDDMAAHISKQTIIRNLR